MNLFTKPGNWFGPLGALPRKARFLCDMSISARKINRLLIGATQPRSRSQVCQQSVNSSITLIQDTKSCLDMPVAAKVFILDLFVVYALNEYMQKCVGICSERCGDVCFFRCNRPLLLPEVWSPSESVWPCEGLMHGHSKPLREVGSKPCSAGEPRHPNVMLHSPSLCMLWSSKLSATCKTL